MNETNIAWWYAEQFARLLDSIADTDEYYEFLKGKTNEVEAVKNKLKGRAERGANSQKPMVTHETT